MILKAGTYRFNDIFKFGITPAGEQQIYPINFSISTYRDDVGEITLYFDDMRIQHQGESETLGNIYWHLVSSTPDLSSIGLVYDYDYRFYSNEMWTNSMEIPTSDTQTVTLATDQTVDDVFGTCFIENTNYNEVNGSTEITFSTLKTKIQSLIDKSNAKTGKTDTDLTTAVDGLIEGYGSTEETPYFDGTVIIEKAESVLGLRRFKETMTPINDVPLPNTSTQDEVLPYCFDVEGEVTINENTFQVTKMSCLLTVNNLANTGTYNAIYYFFTVDGEIGAELGYMNDNYIDEAFNIPFTITNTNGFDEWLLANTEGVSV